MYVTKKELETKVQELRSLKAMKEELENELKAVEYQIIEYMTENGLDTEITETAKITYKPQSRTTLDKEKLSEILGDDLRPFEKTTSYNVLRIKQHQKTAEGHPSKVYRYNATATKQFNQGGKNMQTQTTQFAVETKNGVVKNIGRSTILQPKTIYSGKGTKWHSDKPKKKNN